MKHTLNLVPLLLVMAAAPAAAQTGIQAGPTITGPSEPRPIPIGRPTVSRLDASDPVLEEGSYYETWSFQARAGQLLVISMGSDDFDTFVTLGRGTETAFQEITFSDDALQSTDSSIEFRVPEDGTYLIRSRSFEKGETGEYVLLVFDAS